MAMVVTHISAAVASLVWALIEWIKFGKPSVVGIVTGTIAGLASITPASGFVGPIGAVVIGIAAGIICQWFTTWIRTTCKIDDSLDVFAVHGVGGIIGTLLVAVFAAAEFGGVGLPEGTSTGHQFYVQATGLLSWHSPVCERFHGSQVLAQGPTCKACERRVLSHTHESALQAVIETTTYSFCLI